MKKLIAILLFTTLPTSAFAWAAYDYVPVATDQQDTDEQSVASYDPAMVPLDMAESSDSDDSASTNMPLDAD